MSAIISQCGKYRYSLSRGEPEKIVCFVMLNPSTADHQQDDPTIRRCLGYMRDWGYTGLRVLNIYAYRATDPSELTKVSDPHGSGNRGAWEDELPRADLVVCAWGSKARLSHVRHFQSVARRLGVDLYCLDTTKSGMPKHPLYLKADLKPKPLGPL